MRLTFMAALLACSAAALFAADDENPLRAAKIGDWTEYKMSGPNVAGTTKMVVSAKTDQEVTYEVTSTFSAFGKDTVMPTQKIKVDLTKAYDPVSAANLQKNNTTIEKLGEGKETLKVGDKELATQWYKTKATTKVSDMTIVSEYTMWFSKDVPVSGMVKTEVTTFGMTTKVELVASGSKPQ